MASNSALAIFNLSGARRLGRQEAGGPGVVRMKCTVVYRVLGGRPAGLNTLGNSSSSSRNGVSGVRTMTLGCVATVRIPEKNWPLRPSIRRPRLQSGRSLKDARKSAPMMGTATSAMTNCHASSLEPKSSLNVL